MTLRFVKTCDACPEQYDVFNGNRQVGYIRLRHGLLRVECPNSGGETVYLEHPKGDGVFEFEERDFFLTEAAVHILSWMAKTRNGEIRPLYVIE